MHPRTRYTKSDNVHLAYQVFGEGPVDFVFVPGFISQIENYWDEPGRADGRLFSRGLRINCCPFQNAIKSALGPYWIHWHGSGRGRLHRH